MKKIKMLLKIPFLSLAICLLFLISPLSYSLSHALQDDNDEPLMPVGAKFSESSLEEEETLVGFDAIGLRKMGNRRKRVAMKRIVKQEITTTNDHENEEDEESSRISGLYKKILYKAHQSSQVNHDKETINTKGSKNSRDVKEKSTSSKRVISARDQETQRLLKAAREIANLMHKDYKEWAHRKPPINNREPLH